MERLKRILKKVFCLPPLATILIAIPSFAFLIVVMALGWTESPVAYVAYVASAYGLLILVTGIPRIVRAVRQSVHNSALMQKVQRHPLGQRLLRDAAFRTKVSLYASLTFNLLYAALKLGTSIYYRSLWFGALAVYYMLLALLRFFIVRYVHKHPVGENLPAEWRRYRICGIFLLLMNQALIVIVVLIVHQNRGYEYAGSLIFVVAMYAFYAITAAIVNLVKSRKRGSPVLSAAKVISLTSATVSMLALETAMLSQFNESGPEFRQCMTAITGTGVCVLILAIAVLMIIHSTKQLKQTQGDPSPQSHWKGNKLP